MENLCDSEVSKPLIKIDGTVSKDYTDNNIKFFKVEYKPFTYFRVPEFTTSQSIQIKTIIDPETLDSIKTRFVIDQEKST
jgi:hypothetical protein